MKTISDLLMELENYAPEWEFLVTLHQGVFSISGHSGNISIASRYFHYSDDMKYVFDTIMGVVENV